MFVYNKMDNIIRQVVNVTGFYLPLYSTALRTFSHLPLDCIYIAKMAYIEDGPTKMWTNIK